MEFNSVLAQRQHPFLQTLIVFLKLNLVYTMKLLFAIFQEVNFTNNLQPVLPFHCFANATINIS